MQQMNPRTVSRNRFVEPERPQSAPHQWKRPKLDLWAVKAWRAGCGAKQAFTLANNSQ